MVRLVEHIPKGRTMRNSSSEKNKSIERFAYSHRSLQRALLPVALLHLLSLASSPMSAVQVRRELEGLSAEYFHPDDFQIQHTLIWEMLETFVAENYLIKDKVSLSYSIRKSGRDVLRKWSAMVSMSEPFFKSLKLSEEDLCHTKTATI